jgi:hypothetical protein
MKKKAIYVFILSLFAVPCFAGPIFSTLGPGDTYDTSTGWVFGVSPSDPLMVDIDIANQFSFGGVTSYFLDTIELAVSKFNGTNELDVWLMSDAAGEPDTIIEAFNFKDAMGDAGQNNPLLIGNSILRPVLSPGTNYWLVTSVPNTDTQAFWNWSSPPSRVLFYIGLTQDHG